MSDPVDPAQVPAPTDSSAFPSPYPGHVNVPGPAAPAGSAPPAGWTPTPLPGTTTHQSWTPTPLPLPQAYGSTPVPPTQPPPSPLPEAAASAPPGATPSATAGGPPPTAPLAPPYAVAGPESPYAALYPGTPQTGAPAVGAYPGGTPSAGTYPPAAYAPNPYAAYPGAPQSGGQYPPGQYPPGQYPPPQYPGGFGARPTGPVSRTPILAIIAISLAAFGILISLVPIFGFFAGLFWFSAFIVSIVALARRASSMKGLAVAALVLSLVGWIVPLSASFIVGESQSDYEQTAPDDTDDDPYVDPDVNPGPQAGEAGSAEDPFPAGSSTIFADPETGEEIWEVSVGEPVVLTQQIADANPYNESPVNGDYVGIPVTLTALSGSAGDPWLGDWDIRTALVDAEGDEYDSTFVVMPDDYRDIAAIENVPEGETVTFWEITDAPSTAETVRLTIGWYTDLHWAAAR